MFNLSLFSNKDIEKAREDIVFFAEQVLGMELFDYERPQLRRYGEMYLTSDYGNHSRPTSDHQDYQRNIFQQWNVFLNQLDGGSRKTKLPTDLHMCRSVPTQKGFIRNTLGDMQLNVFSGTKPKMIDYITTGRLTLNGEVNRNWNYVLADGMHELVIESIYQKSIIEIEGGSLKSYVNIGVSRHDK